MRRLEIRSHSPRIKLIVEGTDRLAEQCIATLSNQRLVEIEPCITDTKVRQWIVESSKSEVSDLVNVGKVFDLRTPTSFERVALKWMSEFVTARSCWIRERRSAHGSASRYHRSGYSRSHRHGVCFQRRQSLTQTAVFQSVNRGSRRYCESPHCTARPVRRNGQATAGDGR